MPERQDALSSGEGGFAHQGPAGGNPRDELATLLLLITRVTAWMRGMSMHLWLPAALWGLLHRFD